MDDQLIDQKLQEALALNEQGKSYSDIREHFHKELSEDEIGYLIRLVDEFVMEEDRILAEIKKAKFKFYIGVITFGLSAILMYKFYTMGELTGAMSLLAYLPMLFALFLLWKGYSDPRKLKNIQPEIDDSKFRMKRRKKVN